MSAVEWINYHHLHYFWVIAREGGISAATRKLKLSQSTLSGQLKELEESVGVPLFSRCGRGLELTEAGRLAFDYAETIFTTGRELFDVLKHGAASPREKAVRVGALSSLSKNLQYEFVRPLVGRADVRLKMTEGPLGSLVKQLKGHALDVVLSNMPVRTDTDSDVFNHKLGAMPVVVVGAPRWKKVADDFPRGVADTPVYASTHQSRVRSELDLFLQQAGVKVHLQAEVDDMALLRLFALWGNGLAVVPEIVVQSELAAHKLVVIHRFDRLSESYYAITARRRFENEIVSELVKGFGKRLKALSMEAEG